MANLNQLPPELKIAVVDFLFDEGWVIDEEVAHVSMDALAALSLANRFFNSVAEPKLYRLGVRRHPYLLCWATDVGYLNTMRKILSMDSLNTGIPIPQTGIIRYRPQDAYTTWDQAAESAKERFYRLYRKDDEPFQHRSDWIGLGDFHGRSLEDYIDDDNYSYEGDEDGTPSENDAAESRNIRRFISESLGVVTWTEDDLDTYDTLNEPKAVYWFPVHIAARHGNLEALTLLVDSRAFLNISSKGFCVHADDPHNEHVLHFPDWTDPYFFDPMALFPAWTPYHIALCHGHPEIARYILDKCQHTSERLRFDSDETADPIPKFISAMRHGYPNIAELCLESKLDDLEFNYPDIFGGSLLWRAFWELETFETFEKALEMLLRRGADLECDLGKGHTLLVEACYQGHYREALALIDAGANVNVVLEEPGHDTTMEEAISGRVKHPLLGTSVLELCCRILPWGPSTSPVGKPSPDVALAVVKRLIESGVGDNVKNAAFLVACRYHQMKLLKLLLESGVNMYSTDVDGKGPLTNAVTVDGDWDLETWSNDLSQTLSIILSHTKTRCRQFEDATSAVEVLLGHCDLINCFGSTLGRITEAILLLVLEGALNVNHGFGDDTLVFQAMAMRNYQLVRGLIDLGAKIEVEHAHECDDLAKLWRMAFDKHSRDWTLNEKMYRLLAKIDSHGRIFKEPFFVATAMLLGARAVVDLMEPRLHLDKDWVNDPGSPYHVRSSDSQGSHEFNGWSLLHFSAFFGHLKICNQLVAVTPTVHLPAKDGETPLSLAIKASPMQRPASRIVNLFMAGKSKLDAEIAVKYRLIAKDAIKYGLWSTVIGILDICPRGHSATSDPLLLHSIVECCFYRDFRLSLTIHDYVIHSGADVNSIDESGCTPLVYLLQCTIEHLIDGEFCLALDAFVCRLLRSLIMAGARPSIINSSGLDALQMMDAIRGWKDKHWEVVETLRTTLLYDVMLYRRSIGM